MENLTDQLNIFQDLSYQSNIDDDAIWEMTDLYRDFMEERERHTGLNRAIQGGPYERCHCVMCQKYRRKG